MFDVASESGSVGGVELSQENDTNTSEGVPESFMTSDGFSTWEGIAQRQVAERFLGVRIGDEGEFMVRIPPVNEVFGKKLHRKGTRSITPVSRLKVCWKIFSN